MNYLTMGAFGIPTVIAIVILFVAGGAACFVIGNLQTRIEDLEDVDRAQDKQLTAISTLEKDHDELRQHVFTEDRNIEYELDLLRGTDRSGMNPCRPTDGYHVEPHSYDYCPQ